MRIKLLKFFNIFLIVSLVFFPFGHMDGMQSDNYAIEKDSINFGGMDDSESSSYKLSDTMGEVGTGEMSEKCFSMNFDGVDDYVDAGNGSSLNNMAYASWAFWYKAGNTVDILLSKVPTNQAGAFRFFNEGGYLSAEVATENNGWYSVGTYVRSPVGGQGVWQHAVVVYNGSNILIYINGALTATSTPAISGNIQNTGGSLKIGAELSDDLSKFSGSIDDVRFYNRALSATEIEDLHKGNQINNTGLVGYWGFDEGSGTTTADLSGNGNIGTISGATFSSDTPLATCSVLNAGYREMLPSYISMTDPADVIMSPDIGGVSGGTGDGSATWNVKTDSPAGYQVSVRAGTSPALKSGSDSFADYTPMTTGTPDFTWNIASTDSEFGYTVEGDNAIGKFLDNGGGTCGVGSGNVADKCWFPFSGADSSIVNASSPNHPLGSDTTVKFKAQSGSGHLQPEGIYTATIVVTAVAL